ncbi:gene transfer agent family protein [Ancylobacter oerskovii]|uniref:Gene transfer agent family protein n=1 Tax=Ancylobacter oerskovii TaxID=459519 RepID=A0ABW4YXH1_9HYPH|nr:gene transfer agent family protein [Ancylobacter oerskovii]MBS7542003.1 gene transfer agent family protein [Ancylobacter oerskovii]
MNVFAANRYRGEIVAELDGRRRRLVLTLGALAELEEAFGAADLVALAERFGAGRLSARDAARVIAAGLGGAGEEIGAAEVARMTTPGGATGFARIVGDLIAATFGAVPEEGRPDLPAAAEAVPDPRVPRRD